MSDQAANSADLSSIRGELKVLKITVFFMIVYAATNFASILRLLGVPGLPPLLLLQYRVMDMLILIAFLVYCRPKIKVRGIDLFLLIFATYPFFIGLARGNYSLTFLNDTVIFYFFLAKVVILRTIVSRISVVTDLDSVFTKLARKLVFWCGLIGAILLAAGVILLGGSSDYYYQAPSELTFAAAIVLAQGNIVAFLFFLTIALAAGKRMVMVGLLVMAAFAVLGLHSNLRRAFVRFLPVALVLLPMAIPAGSTLLGSDLVFADKLLGTFRQIERAMESSGSFMEMLMYTDPQRFAEYVSLLPYLTDWSLWFGNGYGFRYETDSAFLASFGLEGGIEITNAHFTPLAITSKFGLFGLMIWIILIVQVSTTKINRKSFVEYACRLAFISMIAQSFFAFGFFINIFTPFYIAMLTAGSRRTKASTLPGTVVSDQQRGDA